MHFWVFFRSMYRMGVFFLGGGLLSFQIFFFFFFFLGGGGGFLKFLIFFGGEGVYGRCWARASTPTPWDCRMTTTKSCRFVGGRDATVALPA